MENLKIRFTMDAEKKVITFFFQNGELRGWIRKAMEEYPDWSNAKLSKNGSECLSYFIGKSMKEICERANIEGWKTFQPKIVLFNSKKELPRQLQLAEL
jgi:hypothetical protein|tara:strand:- start:3393 stop:3689 length:297 start_codon:yes stop_codon:yes gene_type:complete